MMKLRTFKGIMFPQDTKRATGWLAVFSLLLSVWCSAEPANWEHPRGPGYNGHIPSPILRSSWTNFTPVTVWKRRVGQGYSGCAIVDGKIFTQAQNAGGQFLLCLDLQTGDEVWRKRYGWPWSMDSRWPGPYASPSHKDGRVFFVGCYGILGCANARDGSIVWQRNPVKEFDGKGMGFGYACSPVVEHERVYLPVGGASAAVVAFHAKDGSVAWKAGHDSAGYTPCYPITVAGRPQIVSYLENTLVCNDADSGELIWSREMSNGYDAHPSWPLFSEPFVLCGFAFRRGSETYRLAHHEDMVDVELAWKSEALSMDIFSGVVVDGFVYAFDIQDAQSNENGGTRGELVCLELATGVERWRTNTIAHTSVLTDGKHLYMFTEDCDLIVAQASSHAYEEVSRTAILPGEISWTEPAFYGDYMVVRSQTHLACVYLGESAAVATSEAEGPQVGGTLTAWFERYRTDAFLSPSARDWFWWGLASVLCGAILPIGYGVCTVKRPYLFWYAGLGSALVLGLLGVPLFTPLFGRLVMTWPVVLHSLLVALLVLGLHASHSGRKRDAWLARLVLLVFALVCLGYSVVCRRYFIVSACSFVPGVIPVLPFAYWSAYMIVNRKHVALIGIALSISIAIFFLSSMLIYAWRMG